ncbi:MAG TPA: deoxyribonuclease IV [Patescibacteria group bacterium]|nr:deoxyribonuclease IV [Patescibacteria group bacterium]
MSRPALPDGRPLGAHLPLGTGMVRAVERAHAIGADALQVFIDNPTAWKRRAAAPAELPAFRERLAALGIGPIAVHASYLVNLASPAEDLFERSVALLAHELAAAPDFGARFVNVHVGSHRGAGVAAGVVRVADGVARALEEGGGASTAPVAAADAPVGSEGPPLLVLENAAGSGDGIGASIEELEAIFEALAARGVPAERVGLCLDTAHLWGAGHDVATADGVDGIVEELASRIGLERLVMIHLNDSKATRGSRLDRHEHLGAGEMDGGAGLARFLTHPALARVAYFLETPGMDHGYDAVNVARARSLAAGLPLEPLPPEAFALRGTRSRTPAA